MNEEPVFKAGDTVRFRDGVMLNGTFVPFTSSKAPHRYEGQIAKMEEEKDKVFEWKSPNLVARFSDGGSMYVSLDGMCHAHHWTIVDKEAAP